MKVIDEIQINETWLSIEALVILGNLGFAFQL
jgi:hypothetical protein